MELDRWCFANEKGEPSPIGEADLRAALTSGKLGPNTLVWRSGWKQWMPADRVRQFSKALGQRARDAQDPMVDLKQQEPPPLPLAEAGNGPPARFSTPVPPAHRQKPLIRRPPVPTIADGSMSVGGDTLRPPGAVPPPPRGTPHALMEDPSTGDEPVGGFAPAASQSGQSRRQSMASLRRAPAGGSLLYRERSPTPPKDDSNDDRDLDVPPEELSAPRQPTAELPSIPYDPDSLETRSSTPNLHVKVWSRVQLAPRTRWIQFAVFALAATSLTLGFWLTLRRRPPPLHAAIDGTSTKPLATAAPPSACTVLRPAQRISPSVMMSVAPIAAEVPSAGRLVLGFAEGPTIAAGLTVDPGDLDVSFPFREAKESRILSVTPLLTDGQPSFFVLRENQTIKQARAVDASQDFLFGLSESGFARQPLGGALETVWAVDAKASVTDPRLASVPGLAHAVTFRQAGQSGSIQLGWLTETGGNMSGPFQVKSSVGFLGTPTVAAEPEQALVVYAGRASETDPWAIYLSHAEVGQPPQPATLFNQPSGGKGGDSIAPAVAALPNHRWLLQWSEGPQGQRQVRIQTLDRAGHPIGLSHTVSPVGSNSGQGLLWSSGQRAVSLFVVSVGRSAELWATPIHCP